MDQPGRGRAASVLTSASVEPKPDEALWFDIFRFGHYPERFPGVQIPEGEEAAGLSRMRYQRQSTVQGLLSS